MSRIGIVTGMPFERDLVLRAARRQGWGDAAPLVKAAGIGGSNAEQIVTDMAENDVAGIVSFGVAGALDPDLAAGDIVLAKSVLDSSGNRHDAAFDWRGQLAKHLTAHCRFVGGPLLSMPQLAVSADEKQALKLQHGAAAVDMESAVIAAAADEAKLPFVAVRAISDPSDQALPSAVAEGTRDGNLSLGRLALDVVRRPGQIGDLVRLGLNTRKARGTLELACRIVGPGFAFSRPVGSD